MTDPALLVTGLLHIPNDNDPEARHGFNYASCNMQGRVAHATAIGGLDSIVSTSR